MTRGKRLKPDLRRITVARSYTIAQVATLLDRTPQTVRGWIRCGLPVLPETSPRLICGQELKTWLAAIWEAKKRPCAIDEMYCVKCRRPRRLKPETVKTSPLSSKTATVSGNCGACGTAMQQARSISKLPETIAAMKAGKRRDAHLTGYTAAPLERTLWTRQGDWLDDLQNDGENSVH
ncbi:MAG: hypothetical protein AAGH90_04535 [Pseudomonadota bacterium]